MGSYAEQKERWEARLAHLEEAEVQHADELPPYRRLAGLLGQDAEEVGARPSRAETGTHPRELQPTLETLLDPPRPEMTAHYAHPWLSGLPRNARNAGLTAPFFQNTYFYHAPFADLEQTMANIAYVRDNGPEPERTYANLLVEPFTVIYELRRGGYVGPGTSNAAKFYHLGKMFTKARIALIGLHTVGRGYPASAALQDILSDKTIGDVYFALWKGTTWAPAPTLRLFDMDIMTGQQPNARAKNLPLRKVFIAGTTDPHTLAELYAIARHPNATQSVLDQILREGRWIPRDGPPLSDREAVLDTLRYHSYVLAHLHAQQVDTLPFDKVEYDLKYALRMHYELHEVGGLEDVLDERRFEEWIALYGDHLGYFVQQDPHSRMTSLLPHRDMILRGIESEQRMNRINPPANYFEVEDIADMLMGELSEPSEAQPASEAQPTQPYAPMRPPGDPASSSGAVPYGAELRTNYAHRVDIVDGRGRTIPYDVETPSYLYPNPVPVGQAPPGMRLMTNMRGDIVVVDALGQRTGLYEPNPPRPPRSVLDDDLDRLAEFSNVDQGIKWLRSNEGQGPFF